MIVPLNSANVPMTAEDPTCQKMFLARAPPARMIFLPSAPMISAVPI